LASGVPDEMNEDRSTHLDRRLTRRQTLGIAGAAGSAIVLGGTAGRTFVAGLADADDVTPAMAAKACRLAPEVTEGPFYVELDRIRRDITEGRPGLPLTLRLRVIDEKRCRAIRNAAVDIWHCDAGGLYSDVAQNGTVGQTFLRGVQLTNKKGFATFRTIYPGHYTGRATHIHLKVHIGSRAKGGSLRGGHVCHTGQLFFPESANSSVYALAPHSSDTDPRTLNSSDSIYTQAGGTRAEAALKGTAQSGFTGTIVLGVRPKSTPAGI
jgi:protocatechuate 3,4-dioxygenase beta subunit